MRHEKNIKLYNIIFPVWLLFIFPLTWLIIIPVNFLIDSLILLLGMFILKIGNKLEFYKKTIFWVFLFGFVSDIIGGIMLLVTQFFGENGFFYEYITYAVSMNPFDNIYALLYTLFAVIVAGVLIYVFNRFVSFRKIKELKVKRVISLLLAVLTAPYLFLLPTQTVYGGSTENFTNHIVWSDLIQAEVYLAEDEAADIMEIMPEGHYNYGLVTDIRDGINTADIIKDGDTSHLEFSVVFYKNGTNQKRMEEINFYRDGDRLIFIWKDKYYLVSEENDTRISDAISEHLSPKDAEVTE